MGMSKQKLISDFLGLKPCDFIAFWLYFTTFSEWHHTFHKIRHSLKRKMILAGMLESPTKFQTPLPLYLFHVSELIFLLIVQGVGHFCVTSENNTLKRFTCQSILKKCLICQEYVEFKLMRLVTICFQKKLNENINNLVFPFWG